MKLSIVLPAYNEEENIKDTIMSIYSFLPELKLEESEIIVVNDGSNDKTGELVKSLMLIVPNLKLIEHFPNKGYGGALKAGFKNSTKDWIFFMDSDGQFNFKEIELLIDKSKNNDIIVGYRADRSDTLIRKFNTFGWNIIVSLLFGYLVRDIDCAFKLFKKEILNNIKLEADGAMISTEFLAKVKAGNYKIFELPVTHLPRKKGSPTGANLRVRMKAFRDLFIFRIKLSKELKIERKSQYSIKTP